MKIKEVKSEGLSREYNVTVSAADFTAEVDKKLHEIAKTVSMAGFRAGKVPFAMVKKKYQGNAMSDALDEVVRNGVNEVLKEKELHKEIKGHYYTLRNEEKVCDMLLDEFGVVGKHRHIINGHVPVKTIQGENPIKANGKMMVIDGGFSRAYHSETGIAGYTLVYHSRGFQLVQHEPFTSMQKAIEEGQDIKSSTQIVELSSQRMMVKDTDKGRELVTQINDLKKLLLAYRMGLIKEKAL